MLTRSAFFLSAGTLRPTRQLSWYEWFTHLKVAFEVPVMAKSSYFTLNSNFWVFNLISVWYKNIFVTLLVFMWSSAQNAGTITSFENLHFSTGLFCQYFLHSKNNAKFGKQVQMDSFIFWWTKVLNYFSRQKLRLFLVKGQERHKALVSSDKFTLVFRTPFFKDTV
jgi:hypothetical protein